MEKGKQGYSLPTEEGHGRWAEQSGVTLWQMMSNTEDFMNVSLPGVLPDKESLKGRVSRKSD